MRRSTFALAASALVAAGVPAAEPPLDEAFLEYLAEFADQDGDWTWFADEVDDKQSERRPPPPATSVAQPAARPVKEVPR